MKQTIFGASFSLHRCAELGLDKQAVLQAAINELGLQRFRLMSYWDIHEQQQGEYDFAELDWQMDMVAASGGVVTLAVGVRQPRWPEFHMPDWATKLPPEQWHAALERYLVEVITRYKDHPALHSWQLENEALLKDFGRTDVGDYDRRRLRRELQLIRQAAPGTRVVMTLSNSWGLPWRRPYPDQYAMSLYRITLYKDGRFVRSKIPAWFYRYRALRIESGRFWFFWKGDLHPFIHELQAEPWWGGPISEMPIDTQLMQMGPRQLADNIAFARRTRLSPIDLWGLEWWYWLRQQGHPEVWGQIHHSIVQ